MECADVKSQLDYHSIAEDGALTLARAEARSDTTAEPCPTATEGARAEARSDTPDAEPCPTATKGARNKRLAPLSEQEECRRRVQQVREQQSLHVPLPQSKDPKHQSPRARLPQSKHRGVCWIQAAAKWRGTVLDASERYESGGAKQRHTKLFADEDECNEARQELRRTILARAAEEILRAARQRVESSSVCVHAHVHVHVP